MLLNFEFPIWSIWKATGCQKTHKYLEKLAFFHVVSRV